MVQNRVSQAEPHLPEEVRRLGEATVRSTPYMAMAVFPVSPDDRQIPGGDEYAMRAWRDPQKIAQRGRSAGEVVGTRAGARTWCGCRPLRPGPACGEKS